MIFDPETGSAKKHLEKLIGDGIFSDNVLIIDRLEIPPQLRGKAIGLFVMKRLNERFLPSAGLVAIKPFPLQFEIVRDESKVWTAELGLDKLAKNKRLA